MFEGFERRTIGVGEAEIALRLKGRGPAVVLLHGYPQTHVCWHRVAPSLAERFTVIVPDLRGYGDSRGPAPDPENLTHSKRAMAGDLAGVLDALDIGSAAVAGHDRGGRVAYRFALDHPDRITGLAVLDMIPTIEMWERMDADGFIAGYHWQFLAQPGGLPERMIAHDPDDYLEHTLRSWTVVDDCFSGEAMAEYRRCFRTPSVIAACCADYRAGATVDREIDRADRAAGRRISCPVHALWGSGRRGRGGFDMRDVWQEWCAQPVSGGPIACGHFLPEEAPESTLASLSRFLEDFRRTAE